MSIAVITDVHANYEALSRVLEDIMAQGVDTVFFLGDAVGYGPGPNECVEALRASCSVMLAGNHDMAAIGRLETIWFNPVAKAAIMWTARALSKEHRRALGEMPFSTSVQDACEGGMFLVHSSPYEPESWHYLRNPFEAAAMFDFFTERVCVVGHSHVPFVAELTPGDQLIGRDILHGPIELNAESRYLINAGSVGQPRDGNPSACYMLVEDESITFRRVKYPVEDTQGRMREAGLPPYLIDRLAHGY